MMHWQRVRRVLWISGIVLVALLFAGAVLYALTLPHEDFLFFEYAFQQVWHGEDPSALYGLANQQAWLTRLGYGQLVHTYGRFDQFVYPPQFAVLLSWFAAIPERAASGVWALCTILGYLTGVWWTIQMVCRRRSTPVRSLLFVISMVQLPFLWDLLIGNSNWLIFFLLAMTFYGQSRCTRQWVAGIPLGFAAVFKITPGFIILYALWRRQWSLCLGAIATVLLSTLFTAGIVGWATVWHYVTTIGSFGADSMRNGGAPYNSSIVGVLQSAFAATGISHAGTWVTVGSALFDLMVCVVIVRTARQGNGDIRLDMALSTLGMLLISPLVEGPHLMMALFPLFAVIVLCREMSRRVHHRLYSGVYGGTLAIVVVLLSPIGYVIQGILPIAGWLTMVLLLFLAWGLTAWRVESGFPVPRQPQRDG